MIVTCPNCSKRYMLDDTLLSKEGRQVRCVACQHVWQQAPEVSSLKKGSPIKGIPDIANERTLSSEKPSSWLGWILFIALVLFFISFLIFGRDFIVKMWPPSERFYDLVGLQACLPGAGLSITNTTSQVQQDGSIVMVRIRGDITNISDRVRPIPPLKIRSIGDASHPKCLQNQEGKTCVLDYWEHSLSESPLIPGEKIHFETEPRPNVDGTQFITVDF